MGKDREKRKRVMARSMRLGHCVCDPRQPCPCETFRQYDVCMCAGERLADAQQAPAGEPIRLTQLVRHAGCASKINADDLRRVLSGLPVIEDPRLVVGPATADDAGVFRLTDEVTLVQTVDVFTPVVDDPYLFGQIAAANSVSDVYAMGGKPVTALSIVGFPIQKLSHDLMRTILRGGLDKLAEAEVLIVGGHSINDEEIKFGFAVTGVVGADAVVTNAGAQPGDALVLTKPLGTGILSLAGQLGRASQESLDAAARAMSSLNRIPAELMVELGAHAATDVTGFGLIGHLYHIVRESGVTAEVWWDALPLLPGVWEHAKAGVLSGAAERNRSYAEAALRADDVPEEAMAVICDAQTSGGLLVALAAERAEEYVGRLHEAGVADACIVGRITEKSEGRIVVLKQVARPSGAGIRSATDWRATGKEKPTVSKTPEAKSCCAPKAPEPAAEKPCCAGGAPAKGPGAAEAHGEFMGAAFAPGAIDAVNKELMIIALAVATRCEPCIKIHLAKARDMGISREEIEEAAWLAIAMGGAPVSMFWQEASKRLRHP